MQWRPGSSIKTCVWIGRVATVGLALWCAPARATDADGRQQLLQELAQITVDHEHVVVDADWVILGGSAAQQPDDDVTRDVKQALESYAVVSAEEWSRSYSHVAMMDRTGLLILKNGQKLRWMLRPGGLACLRYPDGRWVYLASGVHDARRPLPWEPSTERSSLLSSPKDKAL